MSNTPVNLIARLPELMQQYDEIQKITDSQNPEFDLLWEAEALIRNNLYIVTAEEAGLRRYERLLGIMPLPGESWQSRRNHILVRWNKTTPYTFRFLIGLLEALTNGNFDIIPNFGEYEMEIVVSTMDSGIIADLGYILRHIIPANIVLTSSNKIHIGISGFVQFAATLNTVKHYTIVQDFKAEYTITGRINHAITMVKTRAYTLAQGYDSEVVTKAQINIGSAVMQTKAITISNAFNAEITANSKVGTAGSVVKVTEYKI